MEYHPLYGPSVPEKGWVPAPSFMLRRDRILRVLTELQPGALLEIGCGAGTLIHELSKRGFVCEALETSQSALAIARYVNGNDVNLHQAPQSHWKERFDYLFAFEVLEHIEDDRAALTDWYSWLKPGGVMLMSVPAHMRRWTASDVWAGHFRRYERSDLIDIVTKGGFIVEHCESYGFPLANVISPLREWVHTHSLRDRGSNKNDVRTLNNDLSGVVRNTESKFYPFLKSFPGMLLMRCAFRLQDWSAGKDWGTGYLLLARKEESSH